MRHTPLLLKPTGKGYLWGGDRLNDDFHKNIDLSPLAETWECSTHKDGPSMVATGLYKGKTLQEVLKEHPEYLGIHANEDGELPILVKLIDANKELSVQVHPTDEYANQYENGQLGKTEMWYVLDAAKNAKLIYGFNHDVTKSVVKNAIENGNLLNHLQEIEVKKNDLFFIEAGTVHAIGAGILVAEIQENSNLTYRLYDYNRVDKDGNKRELHIDKALEVANLKSSSEPRQPLRVLQYSPGVARELLCRCKYFEVHRMMINTERRQNVSYQADELSFRVLLCIAGCGVCSYTDEDGRSNTETYYKGDCIFFPAGSEEVLLQGKGEFLDMRG